jgi:hypothetical protein
MIEMVPKPRLIRRKCGGWLAVSPRCARFRIGVTADTEAHAEGKFWNAYVRWCEINPLVPDR